MDYSDIVKPSKFTNEGYLHELTKHRRQHDPVPYIESGTYKPFWLVTNSLVVSNDIFMAHPFV